MAFRLHYTLHLEVKGILLGGGRAAFRIVTWYRFELQLGGESVPAKCQFAQAFQQRQMVGHVIPALGIGRGIAENTNTIQSLLRRGLAEHAFETKRALAFSQIPHSFRELGIQLDACGRGNRPLKKRLTLFDSPLKVGARPDRVGDEALRCV